MSKSVIYVGPQAGGVVVQVDLDRGVPAAPGEAVDLPDAIAEELVERGEFAHAGATDGHPTKSSPKEAWAAFRVTQGYAVDELDAMSKAELIDLPDTPAEGN